MIGVASQEDESGRGYKMGWEGSRGFNSVILEKVNVLLEEEER